MRTVSACAVIGAAVLTVTVSASPAPASVADRTEPRPAATTVVVDWPTEALHWNVDAWVAVRVRPAQAGRVVRLGLWGMGGPGWSRIDSGKTDSAGRVRLRLLTMCVDGECTQATDRYRVLVLPTATMSGATSKGTIRLEW